MRRSDLEKIRRERLRKVAIITAILRKRHLDDGGTGEAPTPAPPSEPGATRVIDNGDTRVTSAGDERVIA
jgi:hypothetical protein